MGNKVIDRSFQIFLFYALLSLVFLSPSHAIPGESIDNIKKWINKQTFFPIGTSEYFESGIAFYKTLTDNRELVYTIIVDEEKSIWEEIKIISTHVEDLKECRYLFIKDSLKVPQNGKQDTELCYQNIQTTFWNRSEKLFEVINIIYEDRSNIIISDLKTAKLIRQGEMYFRYSNEDNNLHKLNKGPVSISIFEGNKFLYLISNFSAFITLKNNNIFLHDINNSLNDDEQFKKEFDVLENQKLIDQQRSKPYKL